MAKTKIDYKDLMEELNAEVKEGILTLADSIQILRAEAPAFENYCPITDWYYDAYTMEEEFSTPLEEMYMPDEFTKEEWAEMKKEEQELKEQYESDKDKLVSMKVKDVLTEMKQIQKLF